jgi:ACS family phthalate transporter-like MFS transporter
MLLGPAAGHVGISVCLLGIAGACLYGAIVVFWAIPTAYLAGPAAAAGIALISSFGALSGFFIPTIIGWIKVRTGSLYVGLTFVGVVLIVGALVLLIGINASLLRERKTS